MPFCSDQILALASGIYQSIGSPPTQSVGFISGWITLSSTLGDLNNKTSMSFFATGASPCISDPALGDMGGAEGNLLTLMYQAQYYQGAANAVLLNGNTFWTSLTEGDTKISRNPIEFAKLWKSSADEANRLLRLAIGDYSRRLSVPQTVDATALYARPSP